MAVFNPAEWHETLSPEPFEPYLELWHAYPTEHGGMPGAPIASPLLSRRGPPEFPAQSNTNI